MRGGGSTDRYYALTDKAGFPFFFLPLPGAPALPLHGSPGSKGRIVAGVGMGRGHSLVAAASGPLRQGDARRDRQVQGVCRPRGGGVGGVAWRAGRTRAGAASAIQRGMAPCPWWVRLGRSSSKPLFLASALFWVFIRSDKVKLAGAFTRAVPGLADGHSLRPGTHHRAVSSPSGQQAPMSSPSQTRPAGSSASLRLASP